jgi:uncharacterized membrane protein
MFADLPPLVAIHFAAALVALPLGAVQLIAGKGTRPHRAFGYLYAVVMLVALVSALLTWPDRRFLFFYFLAVVGLGTLASGMWNLWRWLRTKDGTHLRRHAVDMGFSWLGLLMAGVSQALLNPRLGIAPGSGTSPTLEPLLFWGVFAAINLGLYAVGSWLIFARLAQAGPISGPREKA